MAAGLVNVALYSLMRFSILVNTALGDGFASTLFVVFGLVSMAMAVPFMLLQRNFKRLLAYSSIEHAGIIVFALGIGTPLALYGAMLHLLNNAIAKVLLFLTASNLRLAYRTKIIWKITGAIRVVPVSATFLIIGVFAITGWPPFGVFISEFTILSAGFAAGMPVPSLLFIAFIATIFVGFMYYTARMVMGEPQSALTGRDADVASLVLLGVLLAGLLMLGISIPPPVHQCIQNAVAVLKG
jgi:hydrogenase-4 component F